MTAQIVGTKTYWMVNGVVFSKREDAVAYLQGLEK